MRILYAPWRGEYTESTARTKNEDATEKECVFCEQCDNDEDEKNFIIKRFPHSVVMLNRYPYNAGHLLIIPINHIRTIDELPSEVQSELMWLVGKSGTALKDALGAEGVNVGINMGKAAGAGIPAHVHIHVLPRWIGDTNFMPTLTETKQLSFDMNDIYKKLKDVFDNINI